MAAVGDIKRKTRKGFVSLRVWRIVLENALPANVGVSPTLAKLPFPLHFVILEGSCDLGAQTFQYTYLV
jgi:hypothetical protein